MSTSVTAILSQSHGIAARPGVKVECPFRHHQTFSIARDDQLGKCFHPSCRRYITPAQHGGQPRHSLAHVLDDIYHDFHRALLDLSEASCENAYSYLVTERQIHPQVVVDSMLGAVPSGGYDLEAKFRPLMEKVEAAIESGAQQPPGRRGRPKKATGFAPEAELSFLMQAKEQLSTCIVGRPGWLCFFYTDAAHRIVAIRFRRPYAKQFVSFKPYKTVAGLFGHGLFTPYESDDRKFLNDRLFVMEGEFNQLQLQSLVVRCAEAAGKEHGYAFACAVEGVNNADFQIVRKVARSPIICYDHDVSGAGFALVEQARQRMSVTAFTTPQPDSDLDQYIRSFGCDHRAARDAVKALVARRQPYPRHYQAVAAEIFAIRRNEGVHHKRREFEIRAEVAKILLTDLHDRGQFYHDETQAYIFLESEKTLIAIGPDDTKCTLMLADYGINPSEEISCYLLDALRIEAFKHGRKTDIYRLAYYNAATFTLYLFNHGNQIYRISPHTIDLVDNGADRVLFLSRSNAQPFEVMEDEESSSWLDRIIVSTINFAADRLTRDEQRLLFTLWFYALFFESLMRTKPILAFIGSKGSGKSITNRKVGMLLFGENFDVTPLTNDPKDFDAAINNSAFVAIDNADTKCHWLDDRLATAATGGLIKKREYYTTNTLVEIPTHCFVAITSRTPQFRRDDVADRLLIMKVERHETFRAEKALLDEVLQNRNQIMSEVVRHLQRVVQALRAEQDADDSGVFRMADFATFAMKVARHVGIERQMKAIFEKLMSEQSAFALEGDPIFELLRTWAAQNPGREVTNTDLGAELAELAEKKKVDFPYIGKVRAFAQRMSQLRSNLKEFFTITERPAGGHKTLFTFTLKQRRNTSHEASRILPFSSISPRNSQGERICNSIL
jgi:hypothetical protein